MRVAKPAINVVNMYKRPDSTQMWQAVAHREQTGMKKHQQGNQQCESGRASIGGGRGDSPVRELTFHFRIRCSRMSR